MSTQNIDSLLIIVLIILLLLPLFNEIDIYGFRFKKEIDEVKEQIRNSIWQLKIDLKNDNHFNPVININNTEKQNKEESEQKLVEEAKEDSEVEKGDKNGEKMFCVSHSDVNEVIPKNEKMRERMQKIRAVENMAFDYLSKMYGENFDKQIKIKDDISGRVILVDGVIRLGDIVREIVEIKFITAMSFRSFGYIAFRVFKRFSNMGISIPLRLVVVSESMTKEAATTMCKEIELMNFVKYNFGKDNVSRVVLEFFKLENGKISKIETD
ncbi:MAG: hypothetical protein WCT40_04165 [Candidatus Magasanikbacteria bacterium]|jgi:hypothetical protein